MLLVRPPGVYRAQTDTALLCRVLRRGYAAGRRVLDVGSGTGALALEAWRVGASSVTAVDVSRRSVAATWLNSRLHGVATPVARGDLFGPFGEQKFDLIVANPPYVPSQSRNLPFQWKSRCWDGGPDGRAILDRICAGAGARLTEDGVILMVHSAVCGPERTVERMGEAGLAGTIVERASIPFGPVMRARATMLAARGLVEPGQSVEELVVVEARRAE